MIINHGSGKKWTKVWRVKFTLQILGSGPIFEARLPWRYCACGQRDYYTSWWRNRQTDPNPIFLSFQQALSNWKPFLRTLLWSVSFHFVIFMWILKRARIKFVTGCSCLQEKSMRFWRKRKRNYSIVSHCLITFWCHRWQMRGRHLKIKTYAIVTIRDCLVSFYNVGKVSYFWTGVRAVELNTEN